MNRLHARFSVWLLGTALASVLAGCGEPPARPPGAARATTPEEARQVARALTAVMAPPDGGFPVARTASGTLRIDMKGRLRDVAVLARGADGKLRTACVSSAEEAERFMTPAPATDPGR